MFVVSKSREKTPVTKYLDDKKFTVVLNSGPNSKSKKREEKSQNSNPNNIPNVKKV